MGKKKKTVNNRVNKTVQDDTWCLTRSGLLIAALVQEAKLLADGAMCIM